MFYLNQNIITGAIDGYTQEYNPISRKEFISVSDDWNVDDYFNISKDIETDEGVTVGFSVLDLWLKKMLLEYKYLLEVQVRFKQ